VKLNSAVHSLLTANRRTQILSFSIPMTLPSSVNFAMPVD